MKLSAFDQNGNSYLTPYAEGAKNKNPPISFN